MSTKKKVKSKISIKPKKNVPVDRYFVIRSADRLDCIECDSAEAVCRELNDWGFFPDNCIIVKGSAFGVQASYSLMDSPTISKLECEDAVLEWED